MLGLGLILNQSVSVLYLNVNEATMLRSGLETFFHPYFINSDNLNVNVNVYEMQNKYELFKKI